jgi:phosphatidylserine/phosphatidylglycerophosphate/cardiolipin synthase-like enzyme
VQLEVRGPAVGDLAHCFRERWEDPAPLERRTPWRRAFERLAREPSQPDPLPPAPPDPPPAGTHAIQVLRTYPVKRPPYPFAPMGERSVARAYIKALRRARRFVYLEDQYLWSFDAAEAFAGALRRRPELHLVAIVPRYPDEDGPLTRPPTTFRQQRVIDLLRSAGGDRVAVYDLEGPDGQPVYVHAKVCVIDDVWMVVGSDNLNRRSWSHDSELACAVIDETLDGRAPADPGGLGDGARRLARDTRLRLWTEHLDRADGDVADLIDLQAGFEALRGSADELDRWHATGRRGPRPTGRLRHHQPEPIPRWSRWWADPVYRLFIDPDGRPRRLRDAHAY